MRRDDYWLAWSLGLCAGVVVSTLAMIVLLARGL
jgi:hypothetical protein